jgi:sugar phosphate isomerase/epimerase
MLFFMTDIRQISLHQLTALDASPLELILIAGQLGCSHVCLFTHVPERARHVYPCLAPADVPAVSDALASSSVGLYNLEVFPLDRDGDMDRFAEALATGSSLGAKRATAHVHDADPERAISRFSEFAHYCELFGIVAGLEFNAFSAVPDLESAARIVRTAGAGSVVLDALHLMRSGGDVDDVGATADLIGYCQMSDGPAAVEEAERWREAIGSRMVPGEGAFPLAAMVRKLRADTVYEAEVPQKPAMTQGVSAFDRAAKAVAGVRRVLAEAQSASAD